MANEDYIAALERELMTYEAPGRENPDRAKEVKAELKRLGVEAGTSKASAPVENTSDATPNEAETTAAKPNKRGTRKRAAK